MKANADQAELSTAADGACDVPADAVGNSGLVTALGFVLTCLYWSLVFMR